MALGCYIITFTIPWKPLNIEISKIYINYENCYEMWKCRYLSNVPWSNIQNDVVGVFFTRKHILKLIVILRKGSQTDFWPLGCYIIIFTSPWKSFNVEIKQNQINIVNISMKCEKCCHLSHKPKNNSKWRGIYFSHKIKNV